MLIEKKKAIINNEKKRHPLSTQILLYGITTCWGTIFEKVEIVKKTQTPPWFLNVIKLRKSSIKF